MEQGRRAIRRRLCRAPVRGRRGQRHTLDQRRPRRDLERLRTAAFLSRAARSDRAVYTRAAARAAASVRSYLETPVSGLWRDKQKLDGTFVDEPAPASSLYHLAGAIAALKTLAIDMAAQTKGAG
jgi:mannose/cellobiose epimerase-like protein (N-acyl-D-glucosamine 2-epimerase family)